MLEWQAVDGGRGRAVTLADAENVWVRVSEDGTVHFFAGIKTAEEIGTTTPTGDLSTFLERLRVVDAIDVVSRSLGGDDPGPMTDA